MVAEFSVACPTCGALVVLQVAVSGCHWASDPDEWFLVPNVTALGQLHTCPNFGIDEDGKPIIIPKRKSLA